MEKNKKERFIRWQSETMKQMGVYNALIITLATASLGFAVSKLIDKDFVIENCCTKRDYFLSLMCLLISLLSGVVLGYNRLLDFRNTAKTIKTDDEDNAQDLRAYTNMLGKLTWILLKIQILSFAIGELLLIFSFYQILMQKFI